MVSFDDAYARHNAAVEAFAARAQQVSHNGWLRAPAAGKWSPAEVATHLTLGFDAVHAELQGGPAMRMRVAGFKKFLVRLLVMRRILRGGHFPSGAPAPRETRPPADLAPQAEAIRRFRDSAAQFENDIVHARHERPGAHVTHPYFGEIGLPDALYISARHVEHHTKQL